MPYHTVQQGEFLASIALRYGFRDWRTIYEHPQNLEFRKRRPNPNVIFPNDRIFIPGKEPKTSACATGRTHVFRVQTQPHCLRIILKDIDGNPLDGVQYKLEAAGQTYTGTTKNDGLVHHDLAVQATEGSLTLEELGLVWNLKIGHLDPVHDEDEDVPIVTGIKARLKNLGYYEGEADDDFDAGTREAVQSFQKKVLQRDDPDGELDRQTRDTLQQEHGS
jgi:Putative peptidoglycan binding domain